MRHEAESPALERALGGGGIRSSSELAAVEVIRRARADGADAELRAWRLLRAMALRPIRDDVVERAVTIAPMDLRALDAIHLAAALLVRPDRFLSYDRRLNEAAATAGLHVESPA